MAKHPATFLDRDGRLIDDAGNIKHPSEVTFYPFTIEALNLFQEYFLLFITTNQSKISKGITTEKKVVDVNRFILTTLKELGIAIYDIFYCLHKSGDMTERKKIKPSFD